ncbi:uncharacterized protein LOC105433594 [Pogonomyrmex barbatus]|uniref:Uncharacterized protein LOC105433594 n=1 Tax=Pogonomyrmex barbatus TaxID=144034 RepID=A0A6I9X3T1_9HYME|nr:uncharacterized protein LOC105433594 [Pogonomyrmex barbatus]XP_011647280.1 uncharacterized protein LOC105433594 [Pogonomyrmex barbatus]
MYIMIDEIVPKHFVVCDFYGIETCFCWNGDKLIIFPYIKETNWVQNARVLSTPFPVRKIQFFDSRAFVICMQGIYKLSRADEFALLSKNALGMGGEFFQVLIAKSDGVYLDDKQIKLSTLLFSLGSNVSEMVCTFPLISANTEAQLINYLVADWDTKKNLCVIAHCEKLYILKDNIAQLIYTSNSAIIDILPVKKRDKVAGLLLLTEYSNMIILIYGDDNNLVFEKIYLGENIKDGTVLCAIFSLCMENVLWIVCSDQSRTYYMKKDLNADAILKIRMEERAFICMQYYKPNVILALSQKKELIELSFEELEHSLSIDNYVELHTEMFNQSAAIMENICDKTKELNLLYENLTDEQDKLRRINLYAAQQKLHVNPNIKILRLCKYRYLTLNITDKLPKNSYVVFTFASKNQNMFCMKKITDTAFSIQMPINENRILCSSSISMDLITLTNEQRPWCLIQNFVNFPPQDLKRKRGSKKDKIAFIDAKIASLQHLIAGRELSMSKLCEIKRIVRAEL